MNFIFDIIKMIFDDFIIILLLIASTVLSYFTVNLLNNIGLHHDNLFLFSFLLYFVMGIILRSKKENKN
ncbi:hypothetical protein A3Q29_04280 [Providencia stuartii]|uniref:Uncharacterized protein n=1 Tax=Providencia stuartii TaxID=588 RepID=A0A1S1HU82_PROST|nr:hypothetical protein A3Q29_04280 [Providencia stuartii]